MAIVTINEYAKMHNRTAPSVYALARRGRFKTIRKSGGTWLIDSDEPYPADARFKSGKYIGWREKHPIKRDKE